MQEEKVIRYLFFISEVIAKHLCLIGNSLLRSDCLLWLRVKYDAQHFEVVYCMSFISGWFPPNPSNLIFESPLLYHVLWNCTKIRSIWGV